MVLHFTHNGKDYEFDRNKLALTEAISLKKASGFTVRGFQDGLNDLDPEALQAMVWLAKQRAGEAVRMQDIDFEIYELCGTLRNEEPASEQPDPPAAPPIPDGSGAGMTPSGGEPSISELLRTT